MAKSIQLKDDDGNVFVKPNYETFTFKVTGGWSGATVGTRARQQSVQLSRNAVCCGTVFVADSSKYIPIPFLSKNILYLNYYACTSGAVTESESQVSVNVIYE